MKIQPVIMCGGSGTRLWPLSRAARPKQFLKLATDKTLFQETVLRTHNADKTYLPPLIIAGAQHEAIARAQLAEIGVAPADIILEPLPRNTAAVAAVAAAWTAEHDKDALVLMAPADHYIADAERFREAIGKGAQAAAQGCIVTFGIKPDRPHTGYGYIQRGAPLTDAAFRVAAFKEKPPLETARRYLEDGGFFWNAGIFLFDAGAMLDALEALAPEIKDAAVKALDRSAASDGARLLNEPAFAACPSISIDYAVMEKTDNAAVVAPVDAGWADIGSWSAVETGPQNENVIALNADNTIIRTDGPAVAAVGVEDLIIIATDDAVLVARRDNAEEVRAIVEELKKRGRDDLL